MTDDHYTPPPRRNSYSCTCSLPSGTIYKLLPGGSVQPRCMSCGWIAGTWQDMNSAMDGWNRACWDKHREIAP
jgi:hypothetical protein